MPPHSDTESRSFFEELENFLSCQHDKILGGDFNSIFDPQLDKFGGNPEARQSTNKILLNTMSCFSLIDIWRERNKSHRNYIWTGRNPVIIQFALVLTNFSTLSELRS